MSKVWLITGSSRGLGRALAEAVLAIGDRLVATARNPAQLADLVERYPDRICAVALNVTDDRAADHAVQSAVDAFGRVDVLVNNAGYGIAGAFASSNEVDQLGMIDLNVRALVELTYAFWPGMLERRHGGVLNVASTAAFQPGPLMAVYYASKAFVLSFSEALWREAQGTGVHVSCLCPGPTASKFRERAGTGKTRLSTLGAPVSSMSVAEAGYAAFQANQRVLITGARNRLLARLVPYLPRRTVLDIAHRIQSPL